MSQFNAPLPKEFHLEGSKKAAVAAALAILENTVEHASGREAYLVVLKHVVVAEDLAQIVAEFEPGAQVLHVRDTPAALQAMSEISALRLAFLIDDRHVEGWSDLVASIMARGGRVVLIPRSEGVKAAPFDDCLILERPFTTEMVQATLDAALVRPSI